MELGNWPIKVQLGSTNSKGLPVLFQGSHQGLFLNKNCYYLLTTHRHHGPLHPSIHPSIHLLCSLLSGVSPSNHRQRHAIGQHLPSPSDIHMPHPEPSYASARGPPRRRSSHLAPQANQSPCLSISPWKLPPRQVKSLPTVPGGGEAVERPPKSSHHPCAPRSPHSAAHSTQPNNPPREGLGRWDAHGGCQTTIENQSWLTPN